MKAPPHPPSPALTSQPLSGTILMLWCYSVSLSLVISLRSCKSWITHPGCLSHSLTHKLEFGREWLVMAILSVQIDGWHLLQSYYAHLPHFKCLFAVSANACVELLNKFGCCTQRGTLKLFWGAGIGLYSSQSCLGVFHQ